MALMMTISMTEFLALSLITLLCIYIAYNFFFHPLRSIPGPLSVRLGLSSWRFARAIKCDYRWKLDNLHRQYGTVVRTGSNEVSLASVEDSKKVYNGTWEFPKSHFYLGFYDGVHPNVFAESNPKVHARLKKVFYPAYNIKSVQQYDGGLNMVLSNFATDLLSCSKLDHVNVSEKITDLTFDLIGRIGFSTDLRGDSNEKVHKLPEISKTVLQACTIIGTQPFILPPIARFAGKVLGNPMEELEEISRRTFRKGDQFSSEEINNVITRTAKSCEDRNETISDIDLGFAGSTFLGAGLDTINVTSQSLIIRLCSLDQSIRERIRKELISTSYTQIGSADDLRKISPYSHAIILETLRLDPASNWLLSRVVTDKKGIIVGQGTKYHLPMNTTLGSSPWIVHRDESYWGSDARSFKPKRWLEDDEEHWTMSFGRAPRSCPGQSLAMTFLSKLFVLLVSDFQLEVISGKRDKEKRIDPETGLSNLNTPFQVQSQWLSSVEGLLCRVMPLSTDKNTSEQT